MMMTLSQKTLSEFTPLMVAGEGRGVGACSAPSEPKRTSSHAPTFSYSGKLHGRGGVPESLSIGESSPAPRLVQTTSKDAYTRAWELGVVGEQERQYLDLIRTAMHGLTDAEAAEQMCLPCSTVSARRNGINQKHAKTAGKYLIVNYDAERRQNRSGNTALVWRLDQERWGNDQQCIRH